MEMIIMAQISLYVEDSVVKRLTLAAKENNSSVSKYVSSIISENLARSEAEEKNKKQVLKRLCGALDDPEFSIPPDIPLDADIPRRYDLI